MIDIACLFIFVAIFFGLAIAVVIQGVAIWRNRRYYKWFWR